ncbi:DegT/DnrJ/EryC1/StrS family aminotransferase [Amycolatopsis saalfeldensis]|uniref:dTDP-4-amino-4,6-dideoxygalactose transaminase n=1 Tax=Amycolatopsis saalfeldensis TaxID=394193 RepID=A0A1H8YK22_9PSEU|nr:DegT/DnrJ/EryC1/StrS family aminotransferase [Amycolatopsis saalfeldensis]SEP52401.1 dTDP-4-amino-4,6-dideoxygalactose transaminase [Amycolatopsis saalfeldensis]
MINVFQPSLGEQELAAVREVFESCWIGKGSRVAAFEAAFAAHLGAAPEQVMSTNSCTEATFMAMELLGVGPGDEVVLPTVCFVGTANAVAAHGARPVFCDVDPRTLNATAEHVAARLNPATKAVILLHYGGYPGQVAEVAELCRDRGVKLVEDAANAQASRAGGRACGTFGDVGVWSFDHGKIAVAVDGGMLYARDPELAGRARKLAYFGLEQTSGYDQAMRAQTRWWDFEISSFGRRSVMNDVLAAIGHVQLGKLGDFVARRREVVAAYDEALRGVPGLLTPPPLPDGHETSFYLYWVQLAPGLRDLVARRLYERGIYTTFRYPQLHRVRAYGADDVALPGAEHAAAVTLCLPLHQGLGDRDVEFVSTALVEAAAGRRGDTPDGQVA